MATKANPALAAALKAKSTPAKPKEVAPVFACKGTLCLRDEKNVYFAVGDVGSYVLSIDEKEGASPSFDIVVRQDDEIMLEQSVAIALRVEYHFETGCIFWPSIINDEVNMFGFRFLTPPDSKTTPTMAAQSFVEKYNKCVYMQLTGQQVKDNASDDVDYLSAAGCAEQRRRRDQTPEEDDDVFAMAQDGATFSDTGDGTNTCFAESVVYGRAIVFQKRGDACIAQAHGFTERGLRGDKQEFQVPSVANVTNAVLAHGDRKMFIVDAAASGVEGSLKELDLETGAVVRTFQPEKSDTPLDEWVQGVAHYSKFDAEHQHLLSCISRNAAFVLDTRLNAAVVDTTKGDSFTDLGYKFSAKNKFTCHATSKSGFLVVGDCSGEVRFYTGPPGSKKADGGHHAKLAKTAIKLSTPILHVDVTGDGEYVIVTTADRVLVLCTLYTDDKGGKRNGFEGKMGKHKPAPLALLPSPQQVMSMGGADKVKFSSAVLESNEDGEQWIAATCGSFVCLWSMQSVKRAVEHHATVYCEGKDMKAAALVDVAVPGKRNMVGFLSKNKVGMQVRSSEQRQAPRGGFSFFDE